MRELQHVSEESQVIFWAFQVASSGLIIGAGAAVWYGEWSWELIFESGMLIVFWCFFMWSFANLASVTNTHKTVTCARLWELILLSGDVKVLYMSHPMKEFLEVVGTFPTGWTVCGQILNYRSLAKLAVLPAINSAMRVVAHWHSEDGTARPHEA